MAIITVSRGSYSKGREVAERVAHRLGYVCTSRDLLLEASAQFNIPEIKLIRALHDAPSILERFTSGKEIYLAYVAAALLERVQMDNVVYHGLAGHFYLKGVDHVLNVRILADLADRVELEMKREGISRDEALHIIKKDDAERRQWSLRLFGVDTCDPALYDLVLHIKKITVDDAVDIICHTARLEAFKTTTASQRTLDDLVLAAQAKAAVVQSYPDAEVSVSDGLVHIIVKAIISLRHQATKEIEQLIRPLPGVRDLRIDVT
jgi:cytidylate kinase